MQIQQPHTSVAALLLAALVYTVQAIPVENVPADAGLDVIKNATVPTSRKGQSQTIGYGGHALTATGSLGLTKSNPDGSEQHVSKSMGKKIGFNNDEDIKDPSGVETSGGGNGASGASSHAREDGIAKKLRFGPASAQIANKVREAGSSATAGNNDDDDDL